MTKEKKDQIDRDLSAIIDDLNSEATEIRVHLFGKEDKHDFLFNAGEGLQKCRDAVMLLKLVRGKLI